MTNTKILRKKPALDIDNIIYDAEERLIKEVMRNHTEEI